MAATSALDIFIDTQINALDSLKNGRQKLSELISDMGRDETDISEQKEQLKLLDEKINRFEALIIHFLKRYNLSLDDYRNSRQINR